jgi:hypothetical protein
MNCQLGNITLTARDGRVSSLEHAYIRGSKIRFLILPDMLKNAPMFKRVEASKTGGRGRGLGLGRGRGVRGRGMLQSSNIYWLLFRFYSFSLHITQDVEGEPHQHLEVVHQMYSKTENNKKSLYHKFGFFLYRGKKKQGKPLGLGLWLLCAILVSHFSIYLLFVCCFSFVFVCFIYQTTIPSCWFFLYFFPPSIFFSFLSPFLST